MPKDENRRLFSSGFPDYGTHESEMEKSEDSRNIPYTPYPKSVFFIVVNEFCERFSFYGMRAILTLYLTNVLRYTEDSATVIYHIFVMLAYFMPLFGGLLADSLLGKFRTIFYLSIVYACGNLVLSAAATPPLSLPPIPFSMLGLVLIAVGTGGIKSSVVAFGGDQFQIPGQESQLHTFFSVFYLAINSGSLLSTLITPIFRQDVSCFGDETCYSLAFGVPAAIMLVALTIFIVGKPFYKIREPEGNLIVEIVKCIWHAISNGRRNGKRQSQKHWLDSADDEYDADFIADIKTLFRICILYIPLIVFYCLLEQQGSRWTLQANRMDGRVWGWTIKPDQMQVANSILVLLFIPLFDKILYPLFARCNFLKEQLQRIIAGGFLVAFSFVLCAVVELQLEPTYPILPGFSENSLNFVNTLPCTVNITLGTPTNSSYVQAIIRPNENLFYQAIPSNNYILDVLPENGECQINGDQIEFQNVKLATQPSQAYSILLGAETTETEIGTSGFRLQLIYSEVSDELTKSLEANAKLRIITSISNENVTFRLGSLNNQLDMQVTEINSGASSTKEFSPDIYSVWLLLNNNALLELGTISLEAGGSYLLSVSPNYTSISNTSELTEPLTTLQLDDIAQDSTIMQLYTLTKPNSVLMLWLLPQYIVVTAGEVLFAVTGYNFSYTKAPKTLKSIVQSLLMLTNGLGSLCVIVITALQIFHRQSIEFFFYSGLAFTATFIFIWLSKNFRNNEKEEDEFLQ